MLVLKLSRPTPLTPEEIQRLPDPFAPAAVGAEIIAQGQMELSPDKLALYCFELGKLTLKRWITSTSAASDVNAKNFSSGFCGFIFLSPF
mgnify:CR=1 FL=1